MAKGYHQQEELEISETIRPVIKPTTICAILTTGLFKNGKIKQIDINHAFLKMNAFI